MAGEMRGPGRPQPTLIERLGDERVRAVLFQVLVAGAVLALVWYLVHNTLANLARQEIATGFGFLDRPSNFAIGDTLVDYSAADSYGRAFLVGILNTLRVALIGIVLTTMLGTVIGIARLSPNWLVARLAAVYVDTVRNIPLLLQLFIWYSVITESFPHPRQAYQPLPGVFVSKRGLMFPVPEAHPGWTAALIALGIAVVAVIALAVWAKRRQDASGARFPVATTGAGLLLGLPLIAYLAFGAPTAFDVPALRGFNFRGGLTITPELTALLLGLVIYTAGFIAEIVRSGILAVSRGQSEAGLSLGLSRGLVLRLIVLPQALRIIIPPLTGQYLNLTKNSSLAVAIGYPDVVSVLNTTINQTGQAIEGVLMIMGVYLSISLSIAIFMNWYNAHVALVER